MNNKMTITTYIATITSNVNGLHAPIKGRKVAGWERKQDPEHMLPARDSLQIEGRTQTESKGCKKVMSRK